jgi:hypothetical protein
LTRSAIAPTTCHTRGGGNPENIKCCIKWKYKNLYLQKALKTEIRISISPKIIKNGVINIYSSKIGFFGVKRQNYASICLNFKVNSRIIDIYT